MEAESGSARCVVRLSWRVTEEGHLDDGGEQVVGHGVAPIPWASQVAPYEPERLAEPSGAPEPLDSVLDAAAAGLVGDEVAELGQGGPGCCLDGGAEVVDIAVRVFGDRLLDSCQFHP